jgi:hypothetical protein
MASKGSPLYSPHLERLCAHSLDAVERVVVRLNTLSKNATLEFALAVGRLILEGLYDGNPQVWRSRGKKDVSFRALARHPDLPMSPGSLYRSVAMYDLCARLPVASWSHVMTSHLRCVLPLPFEHQAQLLDLVEQNRWSVRRLELEIETAGHAVVIDPRKGGRTRQSPLRRRILRLRKLFAPDGDLMAEIGHGSWDDAREMLELLNSIEQATSKLKNRLTRMLSGAQSEPPAASASETSPLPTAADRKLRSK